MKKILFSLLLTAISSITLFSCRIIDGEYNENQHCSDFLYVYTGTTDCVISKYLQIMDYSLKLDEILQLQDPYKRDSLEDLYFPSMKVRYSSDGMEAYLIHGAGYSVDDRYFSKIRTGGLSLSEYCVLWKIQDYSYSDGDPLWIEIENKGNGHYALSARDNEHGPYMYVKDLTLDLVALELAERYAEGGYIYEFRVGGSGDIVNMDSCEQHQYDVRMRFDITQELSAFFIPGSSYRYEGGFRYYDGAMDITITSLNGSGKINELLQVKIEGQPSQPVVILSNDGESETFVVNTED